MSEAAKADVITGGPFAGLNHAEQFIAEELSLSLPSSPGDTQKDILLGLLTRRCYTWRGGRITQREPYDGRPRNLTEQEIAVWMFKVIDLDVPDFTHIEVCDQSVLLQVPDDISAEWLKILSYFAYQLEESWTEEKVRAVIHADLIRAEVSGDRYEAQMSRRMGAWRKAIKRVSDYGLQRRLSQISKDRAEASKPPIPVHIGAVVRLHTTGPEFSSEVVGGSTVAMPPGEEPLVCYTTAEPLGGFNTHVVANLRVVTPSPEWVKKNTPVNLGGILSRKSLTP